MHPAYSIVFFTTATGAGYGLLALLGLLTAAGALPSDFQLGVIALGLALSLISAGLVSSAGHLGRPERAWRAVSQWRSSWLSREAIAALATYVPAALFAVGWVILGRTDGWVAAAGVMAAIGAAATVFATGMIYASLKPIRQWHSPFTVPAYLIYAAMTGALLLNAVLQSLALPPAWLAPLALAATLAGWACKAATWRHNDALAAVSSANTGTGLAGGCVHSIEWPHTQENFVLKEMGYRLARKHAARLRRIVHGAAFALPALLLATGMAVDRPRAAILAVLAALVQLLGMLVERWLFFAEARHTVAVYYGR
jgi:DMSO reductase anchor subunit